MSLATPNILIRVSVGGDEQRLRLDLLCDDTGTQSPLDVVARERTKFTKLLVYMGTFISYYSRICITDNALRYLTKIGIAVVSQ